MKLLYRMALSACLAAVLPVAAQTMPAARPAAAGANGGFDCLLEPWQVIEVRSATDGVIASISVSRGDTFRRGQVLMELQSQSEKLTVDLARMRSKPASLAGDFQVGAARFLDDVQQFTKSVHHGLTPFCVGCNSERGEARIPNASP